MIMVIHKRKLIVSLIVIVSLALLAYVDLRSRTETFFQVTNIKGVKTVVLDPGHGGEDPGAVSDYSETKEKDINLKIAKNLKNMLETSGHKVIMTREDDILKYEPGTTNIVKKRSQDLQARKKLIDESGADIAVSIHLNKFPQTQYFGAQTFYPPDFPESKRLAQTIQAKIIEIVDAENKREALVKKEPIIILKNPKVVTAIVEGGFLSNEEEEKKIISQVYQQKLAESIFQGIEDYFNFDADKGND